MNLFVGGFVCWIGLLLATRAQGTYQHYGPYQTHRHADRSVSPGRPHISPRVYQSFPNVQTIYPRFKEALPNQGQSFQTVRPREYTVQGLQQSPRPFNQAPFNQAPINQAPINPSPINRAPINRAPINQAPINREPINQAPIKHISQLSNQLTNQSTNQNSKLTSHKAYRRDILNRW